MSVLNFVVRSISGVLPRTVIWEERRGVMEGGVVCRSQFMGSSWDEMGRGSIVKD